MSDTKKSANDFIFDKTIGEGSFSTVYLAKDVKTKHEYAIKVCEKRLIVKEKKQQAVMREKKILKILTDNPSPFFISLFCTFQDNTRLFFVMNYAKNGELLPFITKSGFDEQCTLFYSGEILLALEHLHKLGIVHRDLKPENILLNEKMHIQITDFGSAMLLNHDNYEPTNSLSNESSNSNETQNKRKNSFVGTAHYISPELLVNQKASPSSDLWAFGCILYQMICGYTPFRAPNEYLIFQKIIGLDYEFSDAFSEAAINLIENILKKKPRQRLGSEDDLLNKGYESIKHHFFYSALADRWTTLHNEIPPPILSTSNSNDDGLKNNEMAVNLPEILDPEPGLADKQITRLMGLALNDDFERNNKIAKKGILDISPKEKMDKLSIQRDQNIFHRFVQENLILKQGFIDKKKGLFARRRMLLLTTGPHLYYVDASNMVLKGQIPWSHHLRPEPKNFKTFFVHTPNRIYYLEDPDGGAPEWCRVIEEVRLATYPNSAIVNLSHTNTNHTNHSNQCNNSVPVRKISVNHKKSR